MGGVKFVSKKIISIFAAEMQSNSSDNNLLLYIITMKQALTLLFLLTSQVCVAQSSFLRFADWLKQQPYSRTCIREDYCAAKGFGTDMLFQVYEQEPLVEYGACDTKIVVPCIGDEQLQELRGRLTSTMEGAEQSWSYHFREDGHVVRTSLAVNGLRGNLLECMSDSGKVRSFDLSDNEDVFETLQQNVFELSDSKLHTIIVYRKDRTAMHSHATPLNLSPADSLLAQSRYASTASKTFVYTPDAPQGLVLSRFAGSERSTTHAQIYEYASEEDMPTAALEAIFYDLLHQRQECEIVHEGETIRISSARECMLIAPKYRRILRARSTTSAGVYVPHTWWE